MTVIIRGCDQHWSADMNDNTLEIGEEIATATDRVCGSCKVRRPLAMFYLATEAKRALREGRDHFYAPCKVCQRATNRKAVAPRQAYTDAVKLAAGCADCKTKIPYPEIYDFDHLPGFEKIRTVAQSMTAGTMEELVDEISKCEVVCSNCHRIRTKRRARELWDRTDA
jgi:hypothetical protein